MCAYTVYHVVTHSGAYTSIKFIQGLLYTEERLECVDLLYTLIYIRENQYARMCVMDYDQYIGRGCCVISFSQSRFDLVTFSVTGVYQ